MAQPTSSVSGALVLFTAISGVDLASTACTAFKKTWFGQRMVSHLGISDVTEAEAAEARANLLPITILTTALATCSVWLGLRK